MKTAVAGRGVSDMLTLVMVLMAVAFESASAVAQGQLLRKETSSGHGPGGLTKEALQDIKSVDCLQARQKDPGAPCSNNTNSDKWPYVRSWGVFRPVEEPANSEGEQSQAKWAVPAGPTAPPPLDIANFPAWQEARCRSGGEYLCDPEKFLQRSARSSIIQELHRFRREVTVECRQFKSDPEAWGTTKREPFKLGIAIAGTWPSEQTDPMTLQKFGLVLLSRWGLMPVYNGAGTGNDVKEYTQGCPNVAMLVILPDHRQAFLSSPSCEFVCGDRGGPEVASAALAALASGGPGAAAAAGLAQVQRVLRETHPLSLENFRKSSSVRNMKRHRAFSRWEKKLWAQEISWVVAARVIFVMVIGLAVFILGSTLYFNITAKRGVLDNPRPVLF